MKIKPVGHTNPLTADDPIKVIISNRKRELFQIQRSLTLLVADLKGSRAEEPITQAINALELVWDQLLQAERLFTQ